MPSPLGSWTAHGCTGACCDTREITCQLSGDPFVLSSALLETFDLLNRDRSREGRVVVALKVVRARLGRCLPGQGARAPGDDQVWVRDHIVACVVLIVLARYTNHVRSRTLVSEVQGQR